MTGLAPADPLQSSPFPSYDEKRGQNEDRHDFPKTARHFGWRCWDFGGGLGCIREFQAGLVAVQPRSPALSAWATFCRVASADRKLADGSVMTAGAWHQQQVAVGRHEAPMSTELPRFMAAWQDRYSQVRQGDPDGRNTAGMWAQRLLGQVRGQTPRWCRANSR